MTAIDDTAEALPDIDFTVDQWLSQQPSVNQAGSVDGCRHPPIGVSSNTGHSKSFRTKGTLDSQFFTKPESLFVKSFQAYLLDALFFSVRHLNRNLHNNFRG